MTHEEICTILTAIQAHSEREEVIDRLDEAICPEIDLNVNRLLEAYLAKDVDGMINAFTGWDMVALLEKAQIIPNSSGAWMGYDWDPEDVILKVMPWEENRNKKELIQNEGKSESS